MKKYYKIYYYFTVERINGKLERITNYFIKLKTIIVKIKSLGSILNEDVKVSVMRPAIGYIPKLNSFWYELNLAEHLEKTTRSGGPNVNYLLECLDYELNWEKLIQKVNLLNQNILSLDPKEILKLVSEWNNLIDTTKELTREQRKCGWILRSMRRLVGDTKIPELKWKEVDGLK